MASIYAESMQRKRDRERAAGLRSVTTPLPQTIIAELDAEKNTRRLMTRGDAIAAIFLEWKELKMAQEATTP